MNSLSIPLTSLIHENLAIVMTFAYSQKSLHDALVSNVAGRVRNLEMTLFENSRTRAERAIIELAMYLRILDDRDGISKYLKLTKSNLYFGTLYKDDESTTNIESRDFMNKVIHAAGYDWIITDNEDPVLRCYAHKTESHKWSKADIDLFSVAFLCGQLAQ
jgi:hypothetical protein